MAGRRTGPFCLEAAFRQVSESHEMNQPHPVVPRICGHYKGPTKRPHSIRRRKDFKFLSLAWRDKKSISPSPLTLTPGRRPPRHARGQGSVLARGGSVACEGFDSRTSRMW